MTDVVERLRYRATCDADFDIISEEAADTIEALRAENARLLQKAAIPICVGRPIISILAREGAWTSASGASVVAASELFRNDPYEEIARLREALRPFTELPCAGMARFSGAPDDYAASEMIPYGMLRAARAAMGETGET